LKLARK